MNRRDDCAENCPHMGFSDRAEYGLYCRGRKIPCVDKDQARARAIS